MHARGLEHQSKGVENCLRSSTCASQPAISGAKAAGRTMITGQGNGQGGREHGQKVRPASGPALADRSRGARARGRRSGASRPKNFRSRATPPQEIMNAIHAGEIKALLSICFNPLVSLPDAEFTREALERAGILRRHRFLHVAKRRTTPMSCSPAACRKRRRASAATSKGRVIHIQQGCRSPGRRAPRLAGSSVELARAARQRRSIFRSTSQREIFEELREASRGGVADYYGITYEKIDEQIRRVLAVSDARSSRARRGCSKTDVLPR